MKKIILSILCLTSFARADMVDNGADVVGSEALEQDIALILEKLSDEDKALVELGVKLHRIIDDSMLGDDLDEASLESLSREELLTLFGGVTKKKCSKCCNSCNKCNKCCKKCKKCCCKVQSMLSQ